MSEYDDDISPELHEFLRDLADKMEAYERGGFNVSFTITGDKISGYLLITHILEEGKK